MALANACKKDPVPGDNPTPGPTSDTITPILPGDTITPIVPGDTITPVDTIVPTPPTPGDTIVPPPAVFDTVMLPIKINNANGCEILYPSVDTVTKLVNMNKIVKLKWYVSITGYWTPGAFISPRDSLRVRFAISPNIIGGGKIYVNKNYGGASLPCSDSLCFSKLGMTECDSAIFAGWGYEPWRDPGSKSQRDAHVKFCDTVGMRRAILGGKQR